MSVPLEDSYKYTSRQQCRLKADNEQQEAIFRKGQAKIACMGRLLARAPLGLWPICRHQLQVIPNKQTAYICARNKH